MECEINLDRGDILIHGFWDRNTDCIIDVCICDVNQASYGLSVICYLVQIWVCSDLALFRFGSDDDQHHISK